MNKRKRLISIIAGVLAAIMLLGILASLLPVSAASSDEIQDQIEELQKQSAAIDSEMAALDVQMQQNLSKMQDVIAQKNRIDQQVTLLHQQIINANDQISAYATMIADKQEELDAAEARYDALSQKNRERVRAMEEDGTLSYWSVLFKATSFADFLDRLSLISEIQSADKRRLTELSDAAKEVADAKDFLTTQKGALSEKRAKLKDSQKELEEKRAEADALLEDLLSRGDEFERYMADAEERQAKAMLELANARSDYESARSQEGSWPTYDGGNGDSPAPTDAEDGWLTPVSGYTITSPFGMRVHPIYGTWTMHYGVDMACNEGTPIYATRSGTVISATYNDSCGNYVQIDHGDGFRSIYMHMTYYVVLPGDEVSQGQLIGYVGSTGDSTGPHLHFGISYNGNYVNPMNYL